MNTFSAFIKNLVISNLWSIFLAILAAAFCTDFIDNDLAMGLFICWFINCIISFFIHVFLFIPGISIYQKYTEEHQIMHAYKSIYPVLLIPLALYVFIMSLILLETSNEPDSFGILAFIGTVLMFMHSVSLYTFIHQILKNNNHEEVLK